MPVLVPESLRQNLHQNGPSFPFPAEQHTRQRQAAILTSQLPVTRWHEQIGDPTAADGILDRLVHNAHRLEMRGDSMRKKRGTEPSS
jgi:hypothetical protein